MDYKNGKIYRIVCNETGLCYIGSTTQPLSKRLSRHKLCFRQFLNGKYHYVTSFDILEKNNYDIVLIEEYSCENKEQLHKRERYYIETIECVNKNIPSRSSKEYNKDNKERFLEINREYYKINKKDILEKKREYYNKNKEEINKKQKERYQKSTQSLESNAM